MKKLSLEIWPVWSSAWRRTGEMHSEDCLQFEEDNRVFEQLVDLAKWDLGVTRQPTIETHPLPKNVLFAVYSHEGIRNVDHDMVGEMRFAYARDLKKLEVGPRALPRNYAIKAYINSLPDDTMVVLHWC